MSTVTAAASALDAAISTLHTTLASYIHACDTANAALRTSNRYQSNHGLENAPQQARAAILGDALTAAVLVGGPVHSSMPPTLAAQHAND